VKDALVDHNLVLLEAIAEKRGVPAPKSRGREAILAMADALLSPASVAIALADLSEAEQAALNALLRHGGRMNTRDFSRDFGAVRPMGAARLRRDTPWRSPDNPAEGLWYRGLVFSAFLHTADGPEEYVFIPADLRAQLPAPPAESMPFQVPLASQPAQIWPSRVPAIEDVFTLLVYLQTHFVRLSAQDTVPPTEQSAIQSRFSHLPTDRPPKEQSRAERFWFDFVLNLARRMDFLRKQGRRLKLNSPAVKDWLQQPAWEQSRRLQRAWRTDSGWNDLWHVPSLVPKETGWENSPMRARAKILDYLSLVSPGEWVAFEAFAQAIKTADPNFQRPDGDYQSWYLYDEQGQPLMGFEHWEAVEGALIRQMIGGTLFALGLVDVGATHATAEPSVFRLTALGEACLNPDRPTQPPDPGPARRIKISPTDFSVQVPAAAGLYDRFQLARFAELFSRGEKTHRYQITRQSFLAALEQSIALEQILAFLNRVTGSNIPLPLVDTLHNWNRRTGSVKLETLRVLRVNHPDILKELSVHPQIGPLLGPPLDATSVVVSEKNLARLKSLLVQFDFLEG